MARSGFAGQETSYNSEFPNLRKYECSMQTSGIHGTLYETVRKGSAPPCADEKE